MYHLVHSFELAFAVHGGDKNDRVHFQCTLDTPLQPNFCT
jgi:hypothetical protein